MSANRIRPSELFAIIGNIDPDAYSNAAYETAWMDVESWGSVAAIIEAGTLGSSATIDAKFQSNTIGSDSGAGDVTGAAITQLTQVGTDSDKQAIIQVNVDKLTQGHKFMKLIVTVGVAACDMSAVVLGFHPRYAPASDWDKATVDEIVSV